MVFLQYKRVNSTNGVTLSVVLSIPTGNDQRWYAMGFNEAQSNMLKTSAIIFWLNPSTGVPEVNTYYITDHSASAITVDDTRLKYNVEPNINSSSNHLYLGFEVNNADAATYNYQNFAIGASDNVPTGSVIDTTINVHDAEQSIRIDFQTSKSLLPSSLGLRGVPLELRLPPVGL